MKFWQWLTTDIGMAIASGFGAMVGIGASYICFRWGSPWVAGLNLIWVPLNCSNLFLALRRIRRGRKARVV